MAVVFGQSNLDVRYPVLVMDGAAQIKSRFVIYLGFTQNVNYPI